VAAERACRQGQAEEGEEGGAHGSSRPRCEAGGGRRPGRPVQREGREHRQRRHVREEEPQRQLERGAERRDGGEQAMERRRLPERGEEREDGEDAVERGEPRARPGRGQQGEEERDGARVDAPGHLVELALAGGERGHEQSGEPSRGEGEPRGPGRAGGRPQRVTVRLREREECHGGERGSQGDDRGPDAHPPRQFRPVAGERRAAEQEEEIGPGGAEAYQRHLRMPGQELEPHGDARESRVCEPAPLGGPLDQEEDQRQPGAGGDDRELLRVYDAESVVAEDAGAEQGRTA